MLEALDSDKTMDDRPTIAAIAEATNRPVAEVMEIARRVGAGHAASPVKAGPAKTKAEPAAKTGGTKKGSTEAPVINESADRILIGLIRRWVVIWFALFTAVFILFSIVSNPNLPIFKWHKPIDFASILIVLIPFYVGIGKIFDARLKIGRDLVAKKEWKQAVAALDPFEMMGQRMLDRTGEAHYLLSLAYTGLKKTDKATKCREFVLKNRKGEWAVKLGGTPKPAARSSAPAVEVKRPHPPKSAPKRRF